MYIIKKWSHNLKQQSINKFQKQINIFMAYEYIIVLAYYGFLKKEINEKLELEIKEYSWLLSFNTSRKGRIIKVLYKCFGLKVVSTLLGLYLSFRK